MTQTLTRERKQKFSAILEEQWGFIHSCEKDAVIEKLAEILADASMSRAELATEETAEEYNVDLFRGEYKDYPQSVQEIARVLRDTWKFTLPAKPQKQNKKGQYGFYIQAMESIKQSCAEFGADVLVKVHADWKAGFKNGLAPYTVAQPTSLVNMCAAKARELRDGQPETQPEPKQFPKMVNGRLV